MTYPALQLITRAYYTSGIVSRQLQTVAGSQEQDGLFLLNELLAFKAVATRTIPYWTRYTFNTIVNEPDYFIPGLVACELLTFNIGDVRFGTIPSKRRNFYGRSQVDTISSLPFNWHYERRLNGSTISLFPLPNQIYPLKISGKFGLLDVTFQTDMSLTYDEFYLSYLRYGLAKYLCQYNKIPVPTEIKEELKIIEKTLLDVSPPDFSIQKISTFGRPGQRYGPNWAMVNINNGWLPNNWGY